MTKKLDSKLECPNCHTIYLTLAENVTRSSAIHCTKCCAYMGSWVELESDFIAQGGMDGVFRMDHGRTIKTDDALQPRHANQNERKGLTVTTLMEWNPLPRYASLPVWKITEHSRP
ncbi:hypothetical protein C7476_12436 [Phyllobacterium bourgognense]|uniref:Uncharacterized protein n=1 Tax=Phyllobacterium bourgognense TaxID=314236 RepID=A0A368YEC4_9HYPH|nr:hypothetical protein C7476_12436 [Phyllobacterium bourgognense]